ncbi:hypothetical protein ACGFNU_38350 [Spirillospora sp. NPDC048911]|uniref:hypothetical protein n=1 Tax=Spirillospora sp. NPDC048911 TaxID=3364527 RepID=UPI003723391C
MTTPHDERDPYWCDPHPADTDLLPRDGRRHLGVLESCVRRQWNPAEGPPPPEVITVIDRLAALPGPIAAQVADALTDGLWIGVGPVPGLDHLGHLAGQPIREKSEILWDHVPGATLWDHETRMMVVGTGPHVSGSLADHEIGHVVERRRRAAETCEWETIMLRCRPLLVVDRWHDPYEWWAEAWALVATGQLPRLIRTLSGSEPVAEIITRYYVRHYGLEV